ncbi:hypothetical protein GCM10010123_36690 [Pilimelia anulata]|uniref:Putative pterin-4-alpha-carbinolamine dehydratase n=1 Tax=Pilimelia anulata TaxID=53371 RepID=A0A8J3BER9_9ACTN|nr:4a-hydroxytetrahydrobiopterin dehydratase [Pilimelia anulata]GGK03413.1 hypothetical protein GCM10010123_36690 [Pilimelia anulata]
MPVTLDPAALADAAARLPGWAVAADALRRRYAFPDFARAIGFLAAAATRAERMNHHPEWTNVYNRVDVTLRTHDAGGVTALDVELAEHLDALHAPFADPGSRG